MNAEEYLTQAWAYWGYDASESKPDISQLSDTDLYETTLFTTPNLPSQAHAEVRQEWSRRRLRIKVYRDTSPKKKR